ncbi:MAG: MFS transporter [Kiritimatiellia bacterium]
MSNKSGSRLEQDLRRITLGGCLAQVYATCTASPVTTKFYAHLGASTVQFGILGGMPMILLLLQFFGAYITGKLKHRKYWFIGLMIPARVVHLLIAFLPLCFPKFPLLAWIPLFILLDSLSHGLSNLAGISWLSWMSDLIPRRILNRYWGERQRYMTVVWTMAYLAVAAFRYWGISVPPRVTFPILVTIGSVAGVWDILLFRRVSEPENSVVAGKSPFSIFAEPLRNQQYRSLLTYTSAFMFTATLGASFMQLYVLQVLQVPEWKTTLIWAASGFGPALVARAWGRIADRHGHRPVIVFCAFLKPLICLAFLVINAKNAIFILAPAFLFDSMLNSGRSLAINGFMLKNAPRINRSMFIAACTAFSGIAGGIGSIIGGYLLRHTEWFSPTICGKSWNNYHLLFSISFLLRAACIPLAIRLKEPASSRTATLLAHLRREWPLRIVTYPFELYRR